jgi:enamine deaminase RidA (YjgF/YER057c/UK114 family)
MQSAQKLGEAMHRASCAVITRTGVSRTAFRDRSVERKRITFGSRGCHRASRPLAYHVKPFGRYRANSLPSTRTEVTMAIELMNPDGLFKPDSYYQVAVATGSRLIFLSGQVAQDTSGAIVGKGDPAAQTEQAYRNVAAALKGAGASFSDVVKIKAYVVDWNPAKMGPLVEGAMRVAAEGGFDPRRTMTLIGVSALGSPDLMIEIEATAVVK